MNFDRLVPASIRRMGTEAIRRARAVVLAGALAAAASAYTAWNQLTLDEPRLAALAMAACVFGVLSPLILWVTGAWRALAVALCLILFATMGSMVVATGGAFVAAPFFLSLVSLLAFLALGTRAGLMATFASVVLLVTVRVLRQSGFEFPEEVSGEGMEAAVLRGAVVFQLLLGGIAWVLETLRTTQQREITESEARYTALGDQGNDVLFELDGSGRVRFASRPHGAMLGWRDGGLVGSELRSFVHPEDVDRLRTQIEQALVGGDGRVPPARFGAPGGPWRWFEPSFTAYTTPDGERRLVVVARDLTERMRLEEQLRQSQKMDAIGQLASGVAHDFNNLLTVIGGYGDLVRFSAVTEEVRAAADEILHATERGSLLTRQLLAVSRPSSMRARAVQLNEIVLDLSPMLSLLLTEDVVLRLELDPAVPPIWADPAHVEQILLNLAANARDAMPDGGTLRIRTSRVGDGRTCRLELIDSGVGMDEETRRRAFEAFFTTKEPDRGTGLGLYVVYSMVKAMGGDARVESAPGEGASICLDLPLSAEEAAADSDRASNRTDGRVPGGSETLLVVEDRTDVRELVSGVLRNVGYVVLEAETGAAGLEVSDRHPGTIDLVLADVVMPHLSGPEMAKTLRAQRPGTRFLFMSGQPERAQGLVEEIRGGALILKPLLPSDLCRRVRDALDGAPTEAV